MEVLTGILGIVIILGSIVFVHELGHFVVAKLSKMGVHEFAIGFGPPLISWVRKGTRYSLRAFPLGGYVRIAGMEPGEENEPNGFYTKGFIAKFATILAGATMNFILALVVFVVIGLAIGYYEPAERAVIQRVEPGMPAALAGLRAGDELVEVNGVHHPTSDEAVVALREGHGPARLVVRRDGRQFSRLILPDQITVPEVVGIDIVFRERRLIGVELQSHLARKGPGPSIAAGVKSLSYTFRFAIANIRYIASGKAKITQIGGPVAVMRMSYEVSKNAFTSKALFAEFLSTLAMLSVLIGFFNILPIPALDGGHLATIVVESLFRRITKKEFDRGKVAIVHAVGLMLLLAFIVIISVMNVGQWAGWIQTE
ncbi:MAG TPA: M50 family metallopeptidase [Armatimonadota bacterium]|nr:M50 family metallopeptidase [Armatimonadota bacterium]